MFLAKVYVNFLLQLYDSPNKPFGWRKCRENEKLESIFTHRCVFVCLVPFLAQVQPHPKCMINHFSVDMPINKSTSNTFL
jgi:hypothetical protein